MEFTDQLGNQLTLSKIPVRIVSLVPSQSELLWDLGLRSDIVGVTRFCVHPLELRKQVTSIGGTKKLNIQKIIELRPDLVIGNREENEISQIRELSKHVPVWMSDIVTLEDAYQMMLQVGRMVGKAKAAEKIVSLVREGLSGVQDIFKGLRVAYFIWKKPYMLAASGTFIDEMMKHLGIENVANDLTRYPEVTAEQLKELRPTHLFLSSEPYPFKESDVAELKALVPGSKPLVVDGEMFSWYGSRLLKVSGYMTDLKKIMA